MQIIGCLITAVLKMSGLNQIDHPSGGRETQPSVYSPDSDFAADVSWKTY